MEKPKIVKKMQARRATRKVRPRARRAAQIDFEEEIRHVQALIAAKGNDLASLIKMPAKNAAEVKAKTAEFAGKTHPVKGAFVINPKKGVVWWPFDIRNAWYYHPLKVGKNLIPVKIKPRIRKHEFYTGIGRDRKSTQVAAYRKDLEKTSDAFAGADVEKRAKKLLAEYTKRLNSALAEYQRTGNGAAFKRSMEDAEDFYRAQMSGANGILQEYMAEKRKAA